MPFITSNPAVLEYPEIPLDRFGINLNIAPVWKETDVDGVMNLRLVPYRVLPSGKIDKREDLARSVNVSIFDEATKDPDFASAMNVIWTALQGYISAKGI